MYSSHPLLEIDIRSPLKDRHRTLTCIQRPISQHAHPHAQSPYQPETTQHSIPPHHPLPLAMSVNPLSYPSLPSQTPLMQPQGLSSPPDSPSQVRVSPSSTASTISEDDDLAEQEWQESLAQLALLFNLVILPFAGKYFGRKFAYFSMSL